MSYKNPGRLQRLLSRACGVQPDETRATLTALLLVLMLMCAYYILRPVRDAMASDWSDVQLSWLWTGTFVFSAIAVSVYGGVVSRIRFRWLVPSVYGFFAITFSLVYIGTWTLADRVMLDKAFYIWVSVFSLFHISVFWSFMAEQFHKQQSKRLFGFIGSGASIGAIIGPAIAAGLARSTGTDALLLIASVVLVCTLPVVMNLQHQQTRAEHRPASDSVEIPSYAIGGTSLAGFSEFFRSPYLLGIALFIFLYTSISSFIYFELKNFLVDYDRDARTQIWASLDLVVNTLSILIALFATGRMARYLGLPFTLACMPVMVGLGLLILAAAPMVAVVFALQVVRRAGNYAVTRPAREMLFTAVSQVTRFKAKPVIDIVVYRGGDMLNAWAFTALTQGIGLGLASVAGVGVVIAALWAVVGIYLGRHFNNLHLPQ